MSTPYDPQNPWFRPENPPKKPIDFFSLFSPPGAPPSLLKPLKPKVFVSYHHDNDQWSYDQFSNLFAGNYELFTDTSIGRKIDSEDPIYQSRKIREDHISGSSITVVLIGAETWKRKHVDWEIHSTLAKKHSLLGIVLPTHSKNNLGQIIVPDRLHDNILSGFATWMHWSNDAATVSKAITNTRELSKTSARIVNSRAQLGRNLS